ncbi:MAG: hypothetical protein ACWGON_10595, partial [Gemmatimonadota bacterium]
MKSRYIVTLIVLALGFAAISGIYLRLQENAATGDEPESETSVVVDSALEAARGTAATSAFATGVAVPVEGGTVRHGTFVIWANAEGQAAALRKAPLAAEVTGSIVEVPVREGDFVRAGQLIARIDPSVYELDLKEAEGSLEQAMSTFSELTLGDQRIEDEALRAEREGQARVRSGL